MPITEQRRVGQAGSGTIAHAESGTIAHAESGTIAHAESGNVLFYILLAVILIGLVTAALRMTGQAGANIDAEQASLAASQVRQYASELERGVTFILQNGASENDLRFAYPSAPAAYGDITDNPARQVFGRTGGGVQYRSAPSGASAAGAWEFYASTHAAQVGSPARADLMAVLPGVTPAVCARLNAMNGDGAVQPTDSGTCLYSGTSGRFAGVFGDGTPNTTDEASFTAKPATEACVRCDDGTLNFYHVLMAR